MTQLIAALTSLVILLALLTNCAAERPVVQSHLIRLGVATTVVPAQPNSVLWLAADAGFYQSQGIGVEITALNGTPLVLSGVLAGNLDVGNVSTESVVRVSAQRPGDAVAIDSPDPRSYYVLVTRASLATVGDLRGKTLAVSDLRGLDDAMTEVVFETIGISNDSVRRLVIGDPQTRVAALVAGRVDAITIAIGTWATLSRHLGLKVLIDERQFFEAAPMLAKVNVVRRSEVVHARADLVRFVAALLLASMYYSRHRAAWVVAIQRRRPDLDSAVLRTLWDYYRIGWAVDGGLNIRWCQQTADLLYQTKAFAGTPRTPVSSWTDPSVIAEALARVRASGDSLR